MPGAIWSDPAARARTTPSGSGAVGSIILSSSPQAPTGDSSIIVCIFKRSCVHLPSCELPNPGMPGRAGRFFAYPV